MEEEGVGNSPDTLRYYRTNLGRFAAFSAGRRGDIGDLALEWTSHHYRRAADAVISRATAHTYARAVAVFLNWARKKRLWKGRLVLHCRQSLGDPKSLTFADFQIVARAMRTETGRLARLVLDTGLRAGETLRLRREHFDLADPKGLTIAVRGKGDEPRVVAVGAAMDAELRALVVALPAGAGLFRATAEAYRQRFRRASKKTGIRVSIHRLRHTYARVLADQGCDTAAIMALMGHKTSTMAAHYTRLYRHQAVALGRALSPLDRLMERTSPGPLFDCVSGAAAAPA